MAHVLLQRSAIISPFVSLPPCHLLSIVETETVALMILFGKERLSFFKQSLPLQQRLFLLFFTNIALGTAFLPSNLIQKWNAFPPLPADIPILKFTHDDTLTQAWCDCTLSTNDCQRRGSSQSIHAALESKASERLQSNYPFCSSYPVIVVKLVPDWWKIASFFISTLCAAVIMSPLEGLAGFARGSFCYIALPLLAFVSLACYICRQRGEQAQAQTNEKQAGGKAREQLIHPARLPTAGQSENASNIMPSTRPRCNTWSATSMTTGGGPILTRSRRDYTVGFICALPIELATIKAMLDETHADLPASIFDDNNYTLGRMCSHNVVITCLPTGKYGPISAATVAIRMLLTFRSIRFGLMVGIGGGVPNRRRDIRLGDVVVSKPTKNSPGVFQCDMDFKCTGTLNKPPYVLLNALSRIQANHILNARRIPEFLAKMRKEYPSMRDRVTPTEADNLFLAQYEHPGPKGSCRQCNKSFLMPRPQRRLGPDNPEIHYGPIASVTQVVRDGNLRDRLALRLKNLCFEMEAAGLMDSFPCLVIRGISDYADSHKNDHWKGYAAATAAAYAKELLSVIPPEEVENEQLIPQLPRL